MISIGTFCQSSGAPVQLHILFLAEHYKLAPFVENSSGAKKWNLQTSIKLDDTVSQSYMVSRKLPSDNCRALGPTYIWELQAGSRGPMCGLYLNGMFTHSSQV